MVSPSLARDEVSEDEEDDTVFVTGQRMVGLINSPRTDQDETEWPKVSVSSNINNNRLQCKLIPELDNYWEMYRNLVIINQTTQSNDRNQIKRNLSDIFVGLTPELTIIKLNVKSLK